MRILLTLSIHYEITKQKGDGNKSRYTRGNLSLSPGLVPVTTPEDKSLRVNNLFLLENLVAGSCATFPMNSNWFELNQIVFVFVIV